MGRQLRCGRPKGRWETPRGTIPGGFLWNNTQVSKLSTKDQAHSPTRARVPWPDLTVSGGAEKIGATQSQIAASKQEARVRSRAKVEVSGGVAGGSAGEERSPAAGLTQGSLLSVSSTLPSGRPSPAHHMGYIRSVGLKGNVHRWKQASILVDSGSQQQDLISHAFADRLGVKGVLKGAAAQADGTRIPLYDVRGSVRSD
jgi:hypothetical protein